MSNFKREDLDYNLFYTDTDSIFIDKPLDPSLIGDDLGQFKLENVFEKIVFLASKVYGGQILGSTDEICKVKGLKDKVSVDKLEDLLIKDSELELVNEKWFKDKESGTIEVRNEPYTLTVTDSKRELIYDGNNRFVATEPYKIDESKKIE